MTVAVTAKSGTLSTRLRASGSETTFTFQSKESFASVQGGVLKVNTGTSREWISFTATTESFSAGVYTVTPTGCVRGLKKDATSTSDADDANKKNHSIGVPVSLVEHSVDINLLADSSGDNTFSGDNTVTGSFTFVSTAHGTLRLQNVTTAQRTALTGLQSGVLLYDTDIGSAYLYSAGAWYALSSGSVQPNATESVKGVAQLGTVTNQQNATVTGTTGAGVVVQTRYLISTSAGAGDAYKIAIVGADGLLDKTFLPASAYKFGGDGSDGAFSGGLTITGSNNTYIVKNYTSFTPGANTVTITPTGCIVVINVSGNCDLTGTTINFAGKGNAGGAGGAGGEAGVTPVTAGSAGTDGTGVVVIAKKGGGGGAPTGNTPGAAGAINSLALALSTNLNAVVLAGRQTPFGPGAGGGGGGGGNRSAGTGVAGVGGTGGAGGGCIIFYIAGNLTLSGTTATANGAAGSAGTNGTNATNNATGGGGGGGGGGGTIVMLYNGTLSGTLTPTVAGGAGGAGGTGVNNDPGNPLASGGGGAGGSSQYTDASAGVIGGLASAAGGVGGAGAAGQYLIAKNTVFQ